MALSDFIDWVKGKAAEGIASFSLPASSDNGDQSGGFNPNAVYLEIRVQQIWLTQERELWREFQPYAAVVSEFLRSGEKRTLPAMLGAAELTNKLSLISASDAVEIRNIRVAGPTPYEGDDVTLLVALFRTQTKDWLGRTLGMVEDIARAVGAPGLIAAQPVASSLVSAISSLLGQKELELRCGQYQSWQGPDGSDPDATRLRALHHVIMRRPMKELGDDAAAQFAVKDGRLQHRNGNDLKPYTEHDFILLSIGPREFRDDYKSLEFYDLWQQTQRHVVNGDLTAAERLWRQTAGALYTDELTEHQQEKLYAEYKQRYEDLLERFAQAEEHSRRGPGEAAARAPITMDEQDPLEILSAG